MLVGLGFVLGLMWALARVARKKYGSKPDEVLSVLARQQLGRTSSVAIVRVLDRALVIGITEQGVSLLANTELDEIEAALGLEATASTMPAPKPVTARPVTAHPTALAAPDYPVIEATPVLNDFSDFPDLQALLTSTTTPTTDRPAIDTPSRKSKLDGSALSPATWKQLIHVAREATVRR